MREPGSHPKPPPTHGDREGSGDRHAEGARESAESEPGDPQERPAGADAPSDPGDARTAGHEDRAAHTPPDAANREPGRAVGSEGHPLRVVHCPVNTAGIPWTNVEALRRRGVDARLVVFNRYKLHPEADWSLERRGGLARRQLTQWSALARLVRHTDVFHFYFGLTLVPASLQFPILRSLGKKSVMHYLGSDIRGKSRDELTAGTKATTEVVGSYDAVRWVPHAEVIPPGIDVSSITAAPPSDRSRPVIVHAPSSRRRKGTEDVIEACEGLDAELVLVEGLTHDEAFERYRDADIVVDQLNAGWYGVFAIECMALGKPVVTFLHDEAVRRTEQEFGARVPIVSATRETLRARLEPLVASVAERRRIGVESRAYVERVHDLERITDRLLELYARL